MMDRLVTFSLLGEKRQAIARDTKTDQEARAKILAEISSTFHIEAITPAPANKRPTLWDLIADAFKSQRNAINRHQA